MTAEGGGRVGIMSLARLTWLALFCMAVFDASWEGDDLSKRTEDPDSRVDAFPDIHRDLIGPRNRTVGF